MESYSECIIKSFKHNGQLHRIWQQNWLVPESLLEEEHKEESMIVVINRQTPIQESDGKQWISRVPAVSFFIPGQWFNIVALIEHAGIRYYCNIASPPYLNDGVLTYIDYDLDVIRAIDRSIRIVDQQEYDQHKQLYHYPPLVQAKVMNGLNTLLQRIDSDKAPFRDEVIISYYKNWLSTMGEVEE